MCLYGILPLPVPNSSKFKLFLVVGHLHGQGLLDCFLSRPLMDGRSCFTHLDLQSPNTLLPSAHSLDCLPRSQVPFTATGSVLALMKEEFKQPTHRRVCGETALRSIDFWMSFAAFHTCAWESSSVSGWFNHRFQLYNWSFIIIWNWKFFLNRKGMNKHEGDWVQSNFLQAMEVLFGWILE